MTGISAESWKNEAEHYKELLAQKERELRKCRKWREYWSKRSIGWFNLLQERYKEERSGKES